MSSKEGDDDDFTRAIEESIRCMGNQRLNLSYRGASRHPDDSSLIELKSLNQFHHAYVSNLRREKKILHTHKNTHSHNNIIYIQINTLTQQHHIHTNKYTHTHTSPDSNP